MNFSLTPLAGALLLLVNTWAVAQERSTRLLRDPDINSTHIAFVYANDIWLARHDGSDLQRITTYAGSEYDPHFSPDGQLLAFTGQYDGNTDVYVVPVTGGEPRRLTFHPEADLVRGWTPDGQSVLFASGRARVPYPIPDQFWTIGLNESFPQPFVVPRVTQGQYSPDGDRFAYQMIYSWESEWRNYRGGQNNPIRIIDLKTLEVEKLPWEDSNDKEPVWIGNTVYFLSDRDYAMNIWAYDTDSKQLSQVTSFTEFDCKNLASGGGLLTFENGGILYRLDPTQGEPQEIDITIQGDFAWARPHWVDAKGQIQQAGISPSGLRAVFSARGDIFTVPAEKGSIRNLTNSPGAADRAPAWSPDGKQVSWFSDESGEYALFIADQYGSNVRKITLEEPTYFYTPVWSSDNKHISFGDADRNLWVVNTESEEATLIDNEGYAHPERTIYPAWSPDGQWIAYTKRLDNEYNAIFAYSLAENKSYQMTDGMSDSRAPTWDKDGKYLYFLASTDYGLNVGWLDMSSIERPLNRAIYAIVLSADDPSPMAPESDDETAEDQKEEKNEDEREDEEAEENPTVKIDREGLTQRIIALDIPARTYTDLQAAQDALFFTERVPNGEGQLLHQYKIKDRESKEILEKVRQFHVSSDGQKLLYQQNGNQWGIIDAQDPKPSEGKLATNGMMMKVDPQAEAQQIFKEAWRFQRDYFYVENVHGLDLDRVYETYSPWIADVRHRSDLTYALDILGGETSVGHSFVGGGDYPDIDRVPVGLLGADYERADGRYQITKIYTGESWNPELEAPLSAPGVSVQEGDYLLAVNGQEISDSTNLYSHFAQTANRQTRIKVNDQPSLDGAREVTVVPVSSEYGLRQYDWVEGNRRKVDELSGGKLAYVWLPNTGQGGYSNFNRYYFAQQDKQGAIIDERFNQGGFAADYIVDLLSRELMGYFNNPVGNKKPFTSPAAGIWGPKVMIVNEMAGSGGDYLPYMFKKKEIGPVVGTKTWGGLVGIWDVPPLVDGGRMTAPRGGFFNTEGEWDVENKGVAPTITVEQDPKQVAEGYDPQLEKAVEVALELLEEESPELLAQPPDPVRVRRPTEE